MLKDTQRIRKLDPKVEKETSDKKRTACMEANAKVSKHHWSYTFERSQPIPNNSQQTEWLSNCTWNKTLFTYQRKLVNTCPALSVSNVVPRSSFPAQVAQEKRSQRSKPNMWSSWAHSWRLNWEKVPNEATARLKNTGCYFTIPFVPTDCTQFHHYSNAVGNKAKYTPLEISKILYFTK